MDSVFKGFCFAAAGIGVLLLLGFLFKIYHDGSSRLDWKFIVDKLSARPNRTGIWPAIYGSFLVTGLTFLIAVPVGVAAAIYLEEFNSRKNRFTDFIQLNIANLAGVPSIVYGLLGLAVFVRWMSLGQSVITGALTMAILILPMVIIVTQEALRAVPSSYREASLALGSTEWQAIRHQVLPNAFSGILTGIILSLSRAVGETAPLLVVGAASYISALPRGLRDRYTVLPIQIFDWAGDARKDFNEDAAAAIIVMIVIVLLMNSIAIFLRARSQKV